MSRRGAASAKERDALVARGEALFLEKPRGCVTCHAKGGTDQLVHDVGSGREADKKPAFDTPSLRFVGGTAPYFHDGRYPTLEALLEGSDGKMGHTLDLSHDDVIALKAYLETLGANDEAAVAREKAASSTAAAKSPPPELPVTRVPLPRFGRDAIARTPGAITAITLSDLAVVSIPAPLSGSPAPSTVSEEEAHDLVIDGGSSSIAESLREGDKDGFFVNAHVRGRAIGRLQIGLLEAPISARVITVRAHCGGVGGARYVPARWETIAAAKGSDLTFEVTDAWLDTTRCKAYVASRVSVLARPIAGSSLFAFRDACPTCGPIENLQIIGPRFDVFSAHSSGGRAEVKSASFSHATLPMQKGGGAVLLARVFQDSARDFRGNSGRGAAPDRDTVFGVEVAEAVGDRVPVALSYMVPLDP